MLAFCLACCLGCVAMSYSCPCSSSAPLRCSSFCSKCILSLLSVRTCSCRTTAMPQTQIRYIQPSPLQPRCLHPIPPVACPSTTIHLGGPVRAGLEPSRLLVHTAQACSSGPWVPVCAGSEATVPPAQVHGRGRRGRARQSHLRGTAQEPSRTRGLVPQGHCLAGARRSSYQGWHHDDGLVPMGPG